MDLIFFCFEKRIKMRDKEKDNVRPTVSLRQLAHFFQSTKIKCTCTICVKSQCVWVWVLTGRHQFTRTL